MLADQTPAAKDGLVIMTWEQAKARIRAALGSTDIVSQLLTERREAARIEDEVAA